ncbi:alpha-glucoside transport [Fusarium coicis]|nr:alpha-glucoside transport [Fusarium coicis]
MEKTISAHSVEHNEGLARHDTHDEKKNSNVMLGHAGTWEATLDEAQAANSHEHALTVRQALKSYPWAVAWSLVVSLSIILEGYDTILIGSLYAYPTYAQRFGEYQDATQTYQIPARWQSAMGSGPQAGAIVGAILNGFIIQRFGYRPAFLLGVVLMAAFVMVSFFGMSVELQAVGQILCGLPWGIFATIGPAYASELCPLPLRVYLTAYTNMCFATGQLIGAGLWIPFLFVACVFMPESPWYLVRKGRYEEAEKSVLRVIAAHEKPQAKPLVALMIHTNETEKRISEGTSYWDCFKTADFAYSATYFFQQAGLDSETSYNLNLGGTGMAFCGTVASWFLMRHIGRRNLYLAGMSLMSMWLLIIGALATNTSNPAVKWVQSILCLIWLLTFSLTVGPIGWAIPAEVSSTRLRSKTVVLARTSYYLAQIVANITGKTGFFWFAFACLSVVWAFFRLPETKGRSYEELDLMFEAKLPTRKFKSYDVDAYDNSQ